MPQDVLDILLTLSNLRGFVAGSREAAASVRSIGTATAETNAKTGAAGSRMTGVAGLASKAFMGTAVAAGAFAYESTKMAIAFDKQMEMVHTQAGATQGEVTRMSAAILAMSKSGQYAQGPQQLAEGLFHLESIGLRGARALNALKIAADGAAVGNANLETVTTALGSAWLVGIKGAGNLHSVMATLNATVGAGNMKMQDLVDSLGTGVLPAAKLAGLSLTDVMGALATLSDEGWHGSSAMAQLATAFHFLTDPTKKAQKAIAELHLSTFQLSDTMRTKGLPAALKLLHDRLSTYSPAQQGRLLGDILPAGRGRVLEVLMNQVDRYGMKIHQIQGTSKNFAQDVAATHQTAAFKIHAAWSQIQAFMITIGHALEPVAVALAQAFARFIGWLIKVAPTIGKILPYIAPLVAGFLAYKVAVLAGAAAEIIWAGAGFIMAVITLIPAITSLKDAWVLLNLVMDANPIFIIIAAVVAIGVAIYMLWTHCTAFREALIAVFNALKTAFMVVVNALVAAFKWLAGAAGTVADFIKEHWRIIIVVVFGWLGLAIDFITKHWKWFADAAKFAWKVLSTAATVAWSIVKPVINWIVGAVSWSVSAIAKVYSTLAKIISAPYIWAWNNVIKPVANWIVGAFHWVADQIVKVFNKILGPIKSVVGFLGGAMKAGASVLSSVGNFFGLANGGTVISPGAVWVGENGPELLNLPQGAQVRPLSTGGMPATSSLGANFTFVVPVQINGREVARATGKYVDDRLARQ